MQRLNGELLFSPSDLSGFLACEHLTQLELAVALQEGRRPSYENTYAELLRRKGEEHEQAFLAAIRDAGHRVVEVRRDGLRDFEGGARRTLEAVRLGVDYVYQAVFSTGGWLGIRGPSTRCSSPSIARRSRRFRGSGPRWPTSSSAPANASPCGWSTSRPTTVACASALDPRRPLDRRLGPTPATIARSATSADSARIDWSRRITSSGSRASTAIR